MPAPSRRSPPTRSEANVPNPPELGDTPSSAGGALMRRRTYLIPAAFGIIGCLASSAAPRRTPPALFTISISSERTAFEAGSAVDVQVELKNISEREIRTPPRIWRQNQGESLFTASVFKKGDGAAPETAYDAW